MDYSKVMPTIYRYGATPRVAFVEVGKGYFINGVSLYGCTTGQIVNADIPSTITIVDLVVTSEMTITNPRVIIKGAYLFPLESGFIGVTLANTIKPEIEDMLTGLYRAVSYLDPSLIYSMVNRLSTSSKNMLPEACVGMRHKTISSLEITPCSL